MSEAHPVGLVGRVGPILEANDLGRAIAEAILRANPGAAVVDRGAYLRVTCPGVCVLERKALEAIVGRELSLPGDLERVMPSFAGQIEIGVERVRWLDLREAP